MEPENNKIVEQDAIPTEVHTITEENGVTTGKKVMEYFPEDEHIEILGHKIDEKCGNIEDFMNHIRRIGQLEMENKLYKHRLEVANEFIDSRKEAMIPEHYDDLKYILNECDLESTW